MPGLLIESITSGGQADKAGLRRHDVVLRYNNRQLNSTDDLIAATRTDKAENRLKVIRGREMLEVTVPPGSLGVAVLPYPVPDLHIEGVGEVLARLREAEAREQEVVAEENAAEIARVQLTTAPGLEGFRIIRHIEVVSAEYVGGVNLFRDIMGEITDLVGGRSGTLQKELKAMRQTCLKNLKREAHQLGANAVIAIDLDYSEISGGGKSMLFLVASGTAVEVESIRTETAP